MQRWRWTWLMLIGLAGASLLPWLAFAQPETVTTTDSSAEEEPAKKDQKQPDDPNAIAIEYEDDDEEDEDSFSQPIEQLFSNPAIASGLVSGADAINRSLESLMDAIFYSLLDNQLRIDLETNTWLNARLERDLYTASTGAVVVVDRFGIGPEYGREVWRLRDIVNTLGADASMNVLQIYLRTDGMRVDTNRQVGWFRWALNNWFGLLPLAAAILPPSFDPNQLYDPVRQLQTPFVFPLSASTFYDMPIGSIRSYSITGGLNTALNFDDVVDQAGAKALEDLGGIFPKLPYSVFIRGEYRINVLRRDEHHAWVGVSRINKIGHALNPTLAKTFFVLKGALGASMGQYQWIWEGAPLLLAPVDVRFEQAVAKVFDQVYEFDMRHKTAQDAYESAVAGDFEVAYKRHLDRREQDVPTGVTFHFTRQQKRKEVSADTQPNIGVFRDDRQGRRTSAEIEITDDDGKFYVLEGQKAVGKRKWDILVGPEHQKVQQVVEMRVKRGIERNARGEDEYFYVFVMDEDPMTLRVSLNIQDRYVDAEEYAEYLEVIRYMTKMKLSDVPAIPVRDPERMREARRKGYLMSPHQDRARVHVTPTYLGRFGTQVAMVFDTRAIDQALGRSDDALWAAYGKAYGYGDSDWGNKKYRQSLTFESQWFAPFLMFPLRVFNVRIPQIEAIREADNAVNALRAIRDGDGPLEKLAAFDDLLDTAFPEISIRALLDLVNDSQVPRQVKFFTGAKGHLNKATRAAYRGLNRKVFSVGPPIPPAARYARTKQKLSEFYLDQPRELSDRPEIASIRVTARETPESIRGLDYDPDDTGFADEPEPGSEITKHVFMRIKARDVQPFEPLRIYIRVVQAGRIKFGKLELAEKVIEVMPLEAADPSKALPDQLSYEFFMTGPMSPLSNFVFDRSVATGDEYEVTIAISADGNSWSDERTLTFAYENGRIFRPD